jgi:hypothetical protein
VQVDTAIADDLATSSFFVSCLPTVNWSKDAATTATLHVTNGFDGHVQACVFPAGSILTAGWGSGSTFSFGPAQCTGHAHVGTTWTATLSVDVGASTTNWE